MGLKRHSKYDTRSRYAILSCTRATDGRAPIHRLGGRVVGGMHLRRAARPTNTVPSTRPNRTAKLDNRFAGHAIARRDEIGVRWGAKPCAEVSLQATGAAQVVQLVPSGNARGSGVARGHAEV